MSTHEHTNWLFRETSPYLLQHAHNPVDWYPWGPEALEKASREDKPIFLSIGYSACHWCHVMERESFEDEETADYLNRHFVSVKVDREERPDLDAIYMEAVQAITGQGGWPLSVFLTPDGKPFYGGTYFPLRPRYGMASFRQVLEAVADAYRDRRGEVESEARKLVESLGEQPEAGAGGDGLSVETLDRAEMHLRRAFSPEHGGFGRQPKFPQPMVLDFLLRQHGRTGSTEPLAMVLLTLEKMALGGIYDQLGGGFHRYSVDALWLVPHFEKMLYDNAQLLRTYLHAWQISGRPLFRRVVEETADYVLREMTSGEGGFFSTQDADTEGEEGRFYTWAPAEIEAAVGSEIAPIVAAYYGVTEQGNFEGRNILHVHRAVDEVARDHGLTAEGARAVIEEASRRLFNARQQRIAPGRDEKVLVEWNGLMIHALAECGTVLGDRGYVRAASRAAEFVLAQMSQPDGRLYRTYKDGRAHLHAYLEDYASLARALTALYEATFERRWLEEALRLADLMLAEFGDKAGGGLFQTGAGHERLVARRKDLVDGAVPSGNSMAAEALLRLSLLTGNAGYRERAEGVLRSVAAQMGGQPTGFGRMLCALDLYLGPTREIAFVGETGTDDMEALLREVRARHLPNTVVALRRPGEAAWLALLEGRELVDGRPAAYVCRDGTCGLPVTAPEGVREAVVGR